MRRKASWGWPDKEESGRTGKSQFEIDVLVVNFPEEVMSKSRVWPWSDYDRECRVAGLGCWIGGSQEGRLRFRIETIIQ